MCDPTLCRATGKNKEPREGKPGWGAEKPFWCAGEESGARLKAACTGDDTQVSARQEVPKASARDSKGL